MLYSGHLSAADTFSRTQLSQAMVKTLWFQLIYSAHLSIADIFSENQWCPLLRAFTVPEIEYMKYKMQNQYTKYNVEYTIYKLQYTKFKIQYKIEKIQNTNCITIWKVQYIKQNFKKQI